MAVPSFLFGGNTNETPQSIKQKRDLIRAMMGASGAPRNIGEGLNALGDGILSNVLDRRANAAEAAGTSAANSLFNSIMGTPASAPSAAGPSMPAVSSSSDAGPGPQSYRDAIASIESKGSGDYSAVGPTSPKLGRALGRYQVMEANIAPWSREALGREVTPAEFLASPQLQDQIFDKKFGGYVQQFGPQGAAQAWFAGPGGVGKLDRKDSLGTSVAAYADKFGRAIGGPTQVASNDPSIGMPAAASAIEKTAPGSGYVDPRVANVGPQQTQAAPPLSPPVNVAANPVPPQAPQQMAQAAPQDRFGGVDPRLLQALQNPWLNEGQKASIQVLIQQQQHQAQQAEEQQTWQSRQNYIHQQAEDDLVKHGARPITADERRQWGIPDNDTRPFAMTEKGPELIGTSGQTINVGGQIEARQQAAEAIGLKQDDPRYMGYILNGELPKENQQALTAVDKKAIQDADDLVSANQNAISALGQAEGLSDKANSGWFAGARASIGNNLPDWMVPDIISSPQSSQATTDMDNAIVGQALTQLKTIFGGNPTEGERAILLDLQGSSSMPTAVRKQVFARARALAEKRLEYNQNKANDLRGGNYYKPDRGAGSQVPTAAPNVDDLLKKYGG